MSTKEPFFAFFGTSVDSQFVLEALERVGLVPAFVVDTKEIPQEIYNSEWDFFLVCSYGKILPKKILDLPRRGCLNIHPSLLPKYRGPSPYVSAILQDEREVGVSLMLLEEKMDAGPVLAQARIEIAAEDWPPKGLLLSQMLFVEGVNLLAEVLPQWLAGKLEPAPQDESLATYTKKFNDQDALIDLSKPREAFLKIQAFDKSPRAHFFAKGPSTGSGQAKRVIVTNAAWKGGALEILKVLPEGKKEMSYEEYLRGVRA
ncbi:MAG TPA: methionyl-tRNA formyltransferase [Candidatus Paceibacterota bacterium]